MDRIELLVRRHWWVAALLVITLIGAFARGPQEGYRDAGAVAGVLAAVAVLALLARVRRPEVTALVNAGAVATYFALDNPDGPIYLSVLFSTYAVASRRRVRDWLPWVAVSLGLVTVGIVVRSSGDGAGSAAARAAWFLAVGSAAAAIGTAVRSRRAAREEQTRRAASEEQLRMAQDLHDGVGHGLAVIAMQAGVALHVLDQDPEKARRSLEAIRDTSRESLTALRAELTRLAPSTGEATPLSPRSGLADLPVLVDRVRAGGLEVALAGSPGPVPEEVDSVGYVVVQEALTNVLKHAGARRARVTLTRSGATLTIEVEDNGRGASSAGVGLGISGMRSRVEAIGGRLEAGPAPGGGFVVRAVLPTGGAE